MFLFDHFDFFFYYFQGDENDPDQQSDSEDGSTKGEPQVTPLIELIVCVWPPFWFLSFCIYSVLISWSQGRASPVVFDIH